LSLTLAPALTPTPTKVDTDNSWYVGKKKSKAAAKPAGLCFAFQKGECYRGEACHFRHEWDEAGGEEGTGAV